MNSSIIESALVNPTRKRGRSLSPSLARRVDKKKQAAELFVP
jgi:hypothetical protein